MRPSVSSIRRSRRSTIRSSSTNLQRSRPLGGLGTRFAFVAVALVFGIALRAAVTAPQSVFPDIRLARVEVFVDAGERRSEDVRRQLGLPLERALASLPGVQAMRAYCDPGKLELELDFDPAGDPQADLLAVRARLAERPDLAPDERVTTLLEGPESEPVVTYAFTATSLSQARLAQRLADATLRTFLGTADVGRVTVFAGPRLAFDVRLDPARTARAGLGARAVAEAIAAANGARGVGSIVRGAERLTVESGAPVSDVASLRAIPVGAREPLPLGALAHVALGETSTGRQASFDGVHAVLINLYARPGGDALALARAAATRVERLRGELPPDVRATVAWDQTRLIARSERSLQLAMLVGAAIALLAIGAFLGDRTLVFASAIVLPIALGATVLAIRFAGLRLDLMTMGGLAIAVGLIVDETIVVVEAIARAVDDEPGIDARRAIARARARIARPLIASTAANVVIFAPLGLVGGVPGAFFRALAITLGCALVVSIALSLWLAPLLASALGVRPRPGPASSRFEGWYVAYLRSARRVRPLVIGAAAALVVLSAIALWRTPTDFLPAVDEGQFEIKYALPPGMSLAAADGVANAFERALRLDPAIAHVARLSGVDTDGNLATPPDAGTIRVQLGADSKSSFDEVADRSRERLRDVDPYVALDVHQLLEDQVNDLSGSPEPLVLTVSGPRQPELVRIAGDLADAIVKVRGIVDPFDGVTWEARSLRATLPGARGDADALRARFGGIAATQIETSEGPVPVIVREDAPPGRASDVRFAAPELASSVEDDGGSRVVRVTAEIEDRDLSSVVADVRRAIAPTLQALPPGYEVHVGGAVDAQGRAFAEFAAVFGIALVLAFAVLVAAFDSLRLPLVVLTAVPLAPPGVALALAVTRTPLNVASFMGMLLLIGIVVRSGILLVDAANRRVRAGEDVADAMNAAATERLRPILMTTLATLGALAPLAVGFGAGSELERPLAIAAAGGIVVSTVLTLAIVPLLYVAVVRSARTRGDLSV